MQTLNRQQRQLYKLLQKNTSAVGSTEWDVYINKNGTLDLRHNTETKTGWRFFESMYSLEIDENTTDTNTEINWICYNVKKKLFSECE